MQQKELNRPRPKGYYFLTPVWGESYTRLFLDICVPALLSPGNLPVFQNDPNSQFIIFTTYEDAQTIRAAPVFKDLSETITVNIEYILAPKPHPLSGQIPKHDTMSLCHRRGLAMADAADAATLFLNPDLVFADGSFRTVKRLAEEGKDVILVPGIRTIKQTVPRALKRYQHNNTITVPPRDLMQITLDNLHPVSYSSFWDEGGDDLVAANLYWRAGNEGIVARCYHLHIILIYPQRKNAVFFSTIDADLILTACPDNRYDHVISDSDDFLMIELSDKNQMYLFGIPKASAKGVIDWAEFGAHTRHRQFLQTPIFMRIGDADRGAWQNALKQSDTIVKKLNKGLTRSKLLLILTDRLALAKRMRLYVSYVRLKRANSGRPYASKLMEKIIGKRLQQVYINAQVKLTRAKIFAISKLTGAYLKLYYLIRGIVAKFVQLYRSFLKLSEFGYKVFLKLRGLYDPYEKIRILWCVGVLYNHHGYRKKAVKAWSRGMRLQERQLEKRGTLSEPRVFPGFSWVNAIGHISLLDFFAKKRELGLATNAYRVLAPVEKIANQTYLNCWKDKFEIISDPEVIKYYARSLHEEYPAVFEIDGQWMWKHNAMALLQDRWDATGRGPILMLPDAEIKRGWEFLRRQGVPQNAWFVTLHVRENGPVNGAANDTASIRNSDISLYLKGIKEITDVGGWVIRIGDSMGSPLPDMERVFDYAVSGQQKDWLDVFFLSQCRFAIATNSGPTFVLGTFGIPAVLTNWGPIGDLSHHRNTITLPKLMWSYEKNRLLTFEEQFQEPYGFLDSEKTLAEFGLKPLSNTPYDIVAAVKEMMDILSSASQPSSSDVQRQQKFKQIAEAADVLFRGRLGQDFLARYEVLLESSYHSSNLPSLSFAPSKAKKDSWNF